MNNCDRRRPPDEAAQAEAHATLTQALNRERTVIAWESGTPRIKAPGRRGVSRRSRRGGVRWSKHAVPPVIGPPPVPRPIGPPVLNDRDPVFSEGQRAVEAAK